LEPEYEEVAGTVSSVRLDAIVALCGRVSRTKAAGLIAGEKVFINGQAVLSPSRQMEPGEILSIRGVGKFLFSRNGGQTKKGRISVTFLKYR
ncbi:S4 domain-containing protein, partial [Enterocloster sp.]